MTTRDACSLTFFPMEFLARSWEAGPVLYGVLLTGASEELTGKTGKTRMGRRGLDAGSVFAYRYMTDMDMNILGRQRNEGAGVWRGPRHNKLNLGCRAATSCDWFAGVCEGLVGLY